MKVLGLFILCCFIAGFRADFLEKSVNECIEYDHPDQVPTMGACLDICIGQRADYACYYASKQCCMCTTNCPNPCPSTCNCGFCLVEELFQVAIPKISLGY